VRVLSYSDLRTIKGIPFSRVWLRRLISEKKFPAPIRLSESRVAFLESEIDAWLRDRAAEREHA
jgi:prophage regulatory protein